jgi:hypothetical protein
MISGGGWNADSHDYHDVRGYIFTLISEIISPLSQPL